MALCYVIDPEAQTVSEAFVDEPLQIAEYTKSPLVTFKRVGDYIVCLPQDQEGASYTFLGVRYTGVSVLLKSFPKLSDMDINLFNITKRVKWLS